MANTKINTLKQLRKAPNNGVVLATEGNQLVWKNVSDFTTASDASARTIANEVVEAKKAEIISQVNTAKFIGPVASTTAVDLGTVDSNDLVLVGTQAPYAIYAKINDALVKLGQTDVDLSAYETTSSVDQKLSSAKDELRGELVQNFEFNEFKNNELPTTILNAKDEAKNATLSEVSRDYVSKAEANGKELEVQRQIAQAKQETKREAIEAAAQDATTKADGVKNELDPRITALENKEDRDTKYTLEQVYGTFEHPGSGASNEVLIQTQSDSLFSGEELRGAVVALNGVIQTVNVDIDPVTNGSQFGSLRVTFKEYRLEREDIVTVYVNRLKQVQ